MNQPGNKIIKSSIGAGHRRIWQVWALLLVGLIATSLAAHYTKLEADREAKQEFDFVCNEIQNKIKDRLNAHEQILRSGAAFFDHSGGVSREDWHRFAERQKVDQQLPGIQGIGFALLISRKNLEQHVHDIRAQGFPQYQVRPAGEREIYTSIIYLEPFTNRNLRAFGYDMFSEPVRRTAMERSRDQDAAALSGKVILVQENNTNVQAGTLMYVPVYRVGMAHDTIDQRRNALVGWVYSPYRMNDLMQGILGSWDLTDQKRIHLEVFDSDKVSSDTLLYDSQSDEDHRWVTRKGGAWVASHEARSQRLLEQSAQPMLHLDNEVLADQRSAPQGNEPQGVGTAQGTNSQLTLQSRFNDSTIQRFPPAQEAPSPLTLKSGVVSAGRRWTLRFTRTGGQLTATNYGSVWLVLFGGTGVSVLLAGWFFSVLNTRFKALRMARELTCELAQSEQSYRNQFTGNSSVMLLIDPKDGAILDANAAAVSFYGYLREKLLAMRITDINTLPPVEVLQDMASIRPEQGRRFQFQHRLANGELRDVDVSSSRIQFGGRSVLHSIVFDVTERKQLERELQENHNRLASIIEGTNVGTWRWNVQTGQTEFNERWAEIVGYTLEELAPINIQTWISLVHPDDQKDSESLLQKHFTGSLNYYDYECRMQHKNGQWVWVQDRGKVAEWTTDGRPLAMTGTHTDITERKRAEAALQQAARAGELLRQCILAINACLDFNSAMGCLLKKVIGLDSIDGGALYLIEGQDAVLRHQAGLEPEFVDQVARRPLSTGYIVSGRKRVK